MKIPKGSTVLRLYEQPDGSIEIDFKTGNPLDYIWTTWEKSNWKSIEWLLGKVPNDQSRLTDGVADGQEDRS